MTRLSKNDLLDGARCARRLWLLHRPPAEGMEATVGDDARQALARNDLERLRHAARQAYGTDGADTAPDGGFVAGAPLQAMLARRVPIHRAWVEGAGVGVTVDVLVPRARRAGWQLVHLMASAQVEDRHRVEVAIRVAVARAAGIDVRRAAVATSTTGWLRPDGPGFPGLLQEVDLTAELDQHVAPVQGWIDGAQAVLRRRREPAATVGPHCRQRKQDCAFMAHCAPPAPAAQSPVEWIPKWWHVAKRLRNRGEEPPQDMRDLAEADLTSEQQRVREATLSGQPYFDAERAAAALPTGWPKVFLDFETVTPLVPLWQGWRVRETAAFQFSVHRLGARGRIEHEAFLDLSGADPTEALAQALLQACGLKGPIHVYNMAVERDVILSLARRHPHLAPALDALVPRLFDLLPLTRSHWYHPAQQGSFSLKAVLPTVAPDLDYATLPGVRGGEAASLAWWQAWAPDGDPGRVERLRPELLAYCERDTLALVHLWRHFAGRHST